MRVSGDAVKTNDRRRAFKCVHLAKDLGDELGQAADVALLELQNQLAKSG